MIKTAKYLISSTDYNKCPQDDKKEIAFIGRSNVGKSSLINMLTNDNTLAKISSTPGKTLNINHFIINDNWYLVDLPGYGFAKVSKLMRANIEKMVNNYILNRENLICLFVLIDIRIPAQKIDIDYMYWLGSNNVPFSIIFTKADKIGNQVIIDKVENYKIELLKTWENLPEMFISSAPKEIGKKEILDYINKIIF